MTIKPTASEVDTMPDQLRLARIEHKLDQLSDSLALLARLDERLVTLFSQRDDDRRAFQALEAVVARNRERMDAMALAIHGPGQLLRWAERILWLGIPMIMAAIFMKWNG